MLNICNWLGTIIAEERLIQFQSNRGRLGNRQSIIRRNNNRGCIIAHCRSLCNNIVLRSYVHSYSVVCSIILINFNIKVNYLGNSYINLSSATIGRNNFAVCIQLNTAVRIAQQCIQSIALFFLGQFLCSSIILRNSRYCTICCCFCCCLCGFISNLIRISGCSARRSICLYIGNRFIRNRSYFILKDRIVIRKYNTVIGTVLSNIHSEQAIININIYAACILTNLNITRNSSIFAFN